LITLIIFGGNVQVMKLPLCSILNLSPFPPP
jgi:hypothetical protein